LGISLEIYDSSHNTVNYCQETMNLWWYRVSRSAAATAVPLRRWSRRRIHTTTV